MIPRRYIATVFWDICLLWWAALAVLTIKSCF